MDAGEYVPDELTNPMVRNRIDEDDAEPGFLLDGYPRTLAQVDELDGMIKRTGHAARRRRRARRSTARSIVQRLLQRAETEGRADDTEDVIRRRQEVYDEQTEPLIEVYREPRSLDRGRRHRARSTRSPQRVSHALEAESSDAGRSLMPVATAALDIKTPDQIGRDGGAGLLHGGETLELSAPRSRPVSPPVSSTRSPRSNIRAAGGDARRSRTTGTRRSPPPSARR